MLFRLLTRSGLYDFRPLTLDGFLAFDLGLLTLRLRKWIQKTY